MQEINNKLDTDLYMINRFNAAVDYFKLLFIERVASRSYETSIFNELGGTELLDRVVKNSETKLLDLDEPIAEIFKKFKESFNYITSANTSVDNMTKERIENLDWLRSMIDELSMQCTGRGAIISAASDKLRMEIVYKHNELIKRKTQSL